MSTDWYTDGTMESGLSFPAKPVLVLRDPISRITGMTKLPDGLGGINIILEQTYRD